MNPKIKKAALLFIKCYALIAMLFLAFVIAMAASEKFYEFVVIQLLTFDGKTKEIREMLIDG